MKFKMTLGFLSIFFAANFIASANAATVDELLLANTIEIETTYKGINFLAVSSTENRNAQEFGDRAIWDIQNDRARQLCNLFGFRQPTASTIDWRDYEDSVMVIDSNNSITQIGAKFTIGYLNYTKTTFYYAVFTSVRCTK